MKEAYASRRVLMRLMARWVMSMTIHARVLVATGLDDPLQQGFRFLRRIAEAGIDGRMYFHDEGVRGKTNRSSAQ